MCGLSNFQETVFLSSRNLHKLQFQNGIMEADTYVFSFSEVLPATL